MSTLRTRRANYKRSLNLNTEWNRITANVPPIKEKYIFIQARLIHQGMRDDCRQEIRAMMQERCSNY